MRQKGSAMTAPLVPAEVDLTGFDYFPLYVARLFGSGFHAKASDSEWRAGVTLWLKSWDQHPPGSLPDDDLELCHLAELGRDQKTWRKLKRMALHGWELADDGRLYHAVIAEVVNDAWERKQSRRSRTSAAREARLLQRQSQTNWLARDRQTDRQTKPLNPLRDGEGDQDLFSTNGFKHVAAAAKSAIETRRRELEAIGWNRAMSRSDPVDVVQPRSADEIAIVEAEVAAVRERIAQRQGAA
jgi:hypothetical protein